MEELIEPEDREKIHSFMHSGNNMCKKLEVKETLTEELATLIKDVSLDLKEILYEKIATTIFVEPEVLQFMKSNINEMKKKTLEEGQPLQPDEVHSDSLIMTHPWRKQPVHKNLWINLYNTILGKSLSQTITYNANTETIDWRLSECLADISRSTILAIQNELFQMRDNTLYWLTGPSGLTPVDDLSINLAYIADVDNSINRSVFFAGSGINFFSYTLYEIAFEGKGLNQQPVLNFVIKDNPALSNRCLVTSKYVVYMVHIKKLERKATNLISELVLYDRRRGFRITSLSDPLNLYGSDKINASEYNSIHNIAYSRVGDRFTCTLYLTTKEKAGELMVATYKLGRASLKWMKLNQLAVPIPDQEGLPKVLFKRCRICELAFIALTGAKRPSTEVRVCSITDKNVVYHGVLGQWGAGMAMESIFSCGRDIGVVMSRNYSGTATVVKGVIRVS